MIWLTWRQSRAAAAAIAGFLSVVAVILAITGPGLRDDFRASGLAACAGDGCTNAQHLFAASVNGNPVAVGVYFLALVSLYALPALIGMFWGAPLIAREIESRTLRLTWSQTVTRGRWLGVKLGLLGAGSVVAAGLFSLAVTWWAQPFDQAAERPAHDQGMDLPNRFAPLTFGARGLVPVGYAVFAFVLGLLAGVVLRRTLAAMAVTLAALALVQLTVPATVRSSYNRPVRTSVALQLTPDRPQNILLDNGRMTVSEPVDIPGAWVLAVRTIDRTGSSRPVPAPAACTSTTGTIADCDAAINRLALRQQVAYQPRTRFWSFQLIETAAYLLAALALGGLVRRRVRRLDLS
ncbi:ABC transporter permease [Actinoplanes bogorensis]|uniref:ABC transporter permease n=1 Tax=Paractinoplanes bogorensis TaxID=1610840 RepID=A0ABS5YX43_9ACTN|nr:ABC transporter permease [Actinoplanes bogorensis]MBU2668005.1 ABC transporter permease [Actinoplanes bogorensis]